MKSADDLFDISPEFRKDLVNDSALMKTIQRILSFVIKFLEEIKVMTILQLKIPDEIARLMSSFSKPKEDFVLEAIEEKIIREQGKVKLAEHGIGEAEALTQRAAFATFAEDWDNPEMDAYDKL